ncbi:MAG: WbqC family protein [Ruminococcus sp.]|nr:WbqC family protein [Ruminococcus sp.]
MDHTIVSSHQPHFFPWVGYLDKMAKSDLFIINDIAQLETKSPMTRNKIINEHGAVRYISIPVQKTGHTVLPNRKIKLSDWNASRETIFGILLNSYRKAPFFDEIIPLIRRIFEKEYEYLYQIDLAAIDMFRECLDITTPIVINSTLDVEKGETKSISICNKIKAVGGTVYLSGVGGKKYMDESVFTENGVRVVYQDYKSIVYHQHNTAEFVPNLSALDLLFNCGVGESKRLFWDNVKRGGELF